MFTLALALFVSSAGMVGVAKAEPDAAASARAFIDALSPFLSTTAAEDDLLGTRTEPDGSLTILGFIEDDGGAMARETVRVANVPGAGGIFTRTWSWNGATITTVGVFYEDDAGVVRNVNLLALESAESLERVILDAAARDAVPIAMNVLPFILNYAHPTSIVMLLALAIGIVAVAIVAQAIIDAGHSELALLVLNAYSYGILAPLFFVNVGYPYHIDAEQGEVYRDFPDLYLWRGVKRSAVGAVWDGAYFSRAGDYAESVRVDPNGDLHLLATAWKRDVVGPVTRIDTATTKHPGIYVRQDISRDFALLASGSQAFEAESMITVGAYHSTIGGESPGATVRFHESKRGDQTFIYVPEQSDTISFGITVEDKFFPLVGTRTDSRHRFYTDVTNLGDEVAAIEAYRVTSVGFFATENDAYVPVFGADYWGERAPTDLWALTFALGGGLGDQNVGDIMVRTGVFVLDRFVPVAGTRLDDDFKGHRYDYRSMLSAGVFVANPLDPGAPVPGESPDRALYVPLVASTYDGVVASVPWALANAGDAPGGMPTFLVSAGALGGDDYKPLVGLEYVPGAHEGTRRAQETYRVGVFPGDYAVFIPLAGLSWDGDQTTAGFAQRMALAHTGAAREGESDTKQGVYVGETFMPVTGLHYRPTSADAARPYGHTFIAGAYGPDGAFIPFGSVTVAFSGPATAWVLTESTCDASVRVTPAATAMTHVVTPPCLT